MKYILVFLALISQVIYSQIDTTRCGMGTNFIESFPPDYHLSAPQLGGYLAPATTPNGAYVRIVCIFAQFSGDNNDINSTDWPKNQLPNSNWINGFIGTDPNNPSSFVPGSLSDYYYQMSNHQNTITGYVYPNVVTINGSISSDFGASNLAVLQQVDPNINWTQFDKWDMSSSYHQYFNQTDGHVDAVYIIWRNINTLWDGIGDLLLTDSIPIFTTHDGKKISHRVPTIGMTVNAGRKINSDGTHNYSYRDVTLWILAHEYGHYLWGSGHDFEGAYCEAAARRGLGLMACAYYGPLAMNPYEKYLLGYTTYTDIFYDQQGTLGDYLTNGNSYRIPI